MTNIFQEQDLPSFVDINQFSNNQETCSDSFDISRDS